MCDPITAISLGSAAASGVTGIIGANKAADAQKDAADASAALQKYMYDQTREDYGPYREAGYDALGALAFELGLGPRPGSVGGGGADLNIERIPGTRQGGPAQPAGGRQGGPGYYETPDGDFKYSVQARPGYTAPGGAAVGGGRTNPLFKVGDMTFADRASARSYIKDQRGGGTEYRGFEATPGYQFQLEQGQQAIDRSAAARGGLFSGATMKASQRFGQGLAAQEYNTYLNRLAALAGTGQAATGATASAGQASAANTGNALMTAGQARASGYSGMANALSGGVQNGLGLYALSGGFDADGGSSLAPNSSPVPVPRPS
ncbi:hypothetical protein [Albimonas pacifica]|uniref:Uncharacterized protein n=1 Tax=Albimonas pacifica TaxID=1114924 RepID=A0A1I3LIA9_9RHOB|nr:hypothetical protein [Albimonas pacifica]SFI84479.1 hypothetical protein SAMN05216258_11043 [Albimonas pacifica]